MRWIGPARRPGRWCTRAWATRCGTWRQPASPGRECPMNESRLVVHFLDPLDPPDLAALQAQLSPAITLTAGPAVPADCAILVGGRPQRADLVAAPALHALI